MIADLKYSIRSFARAPALTAALLFTMFLPWYQKSVAIGDRLVEDNQSAFAVFSFVEAAMVLTGLAVLLLLRKRSEGAEFHIPFGDGSVIAAAGAEEALAAAEAFFTSAGSFVMPVVAIDGKPVGDGRPGPLTRRLRELYLGMAGAPAAAA